MTSIGSSAFYGCSNLKKVYNLSSLPISKSSSSNGYIAYYANAVYNCTNAEWLDQFYFVTTNDGTNILCEYTGNSSNLILPDNYEGERYEIDSYVFRNCSFLKSVTIPDGVTSIGDYAFRLCSSLKSVTMPSSVTSIGDYAFQSCFSLTSIVIPESVTCIGDCAFQGCSSLSDMTCLAATPPTCGSSSFFTYGVLHVLPGSGDAYRAAAPWNNFTIVEDARNIINDTDIASLDDAIYINSMEGKIGSQLILPLQMKNSIEVTGFQADLVLPKGISMAEDEDGFPLVELSTQRTKSTKTNIFDFSYQTDGSLRILCGSSKGYSFSGNDGEVVLITLNISEELKEGDYPIVLKNIVITDAQGTNKKKVDFVKSTLTLFDFILGDANGDNEVDVADISSIASYVLGREMSGIIEKAADVNEDTEIDVADISALAYLILHPETAQKAKSRKVATKKDFIENDDNTLYADMLQAEAGTDVALPVMMRNSIEATGFQLDLVLPEGVVLKDAALSNARTTSKRTNLFDYAHQADGTYRILCNSTKGISFNGHDGEVMTLTLHIDKDAELGAQTISLRDMVLTDATGMLREESSLSESTLWVGNTTGILEMASEKDAPTYDLQGRQVNHARQKGLYIMKNRVVAK